MARRVYTVEEPHDLLDSWINGNRSHVRSVLRMEPSKAVATFAAMLALARDEIREDLITAFAEGR